MQPDTTIYQVHFKIASRCNLNCSYCYIYNKADSTWRDKPPVMSDEVFDAALQRVRHQTDSTRQRYLLIGFHGGEPCLVGPRRFDAWCGKAREVLHRIPELDLCIQTNGTLLDEEWAGVFRRHQVNVGVSVDGPKQIHDAFRIDHQGQGSYEQVKRGLATMSDAGIPFTILCVIPLGADPLAVHRHFVETLRCTHVTYLLPLYTHDTIGPVLSRYGPTPCADFLIPIFDEWWFNNTTDVTVGNFKNMVRLILGGKSRMETIGNTPPSYVFINTDGGLECTDTLRVCEDGLVQMKLNVREVGFDAIQQADSMHKTAIFEGMPLPRGCRACAERDTCAGGYLPHRYSHSNGFDNPSVWCADLLKIFGHLRERLAVSAEDTAARRRKLELAVTAPAATALTSVL